MADQHETEAQFAEWLKSQEKGEAAPVETPKPEAQPETVEQEAPETQTVAEEAAELFPGYKDMPEDQRKAIDSLVQSERDRYAALNHQYASLYGKVAPLQRELASLRKTAVPAAPAATPKEPTIAPTASDAGKKQWERLRNELPDDAAAFEELVEARIQDRLKEFEPLKAKADVLDKYEQRIRIEEEAAQLDSEFPEWGKTIDGDDFQEWVSALRETNHGRYQEVVSVLEGKSAKEHAKMLRDFNLDLREVLLYERENAVTKPNPVRKPEPDPSPRSNAPAFSGKKHANPEEEAFARWKAANPD